MKLLSLIAFKWADVPSPVILDGAYHLQEFSYFQRGSIKEFCTFFSRTVVSRIPTGSRECFPEQEYRCYVHKRSNGFAGVVIADVEYPARVAFSVINKTIDETEAKVDAGTAVGSDFSVKLPFLEGLLRDFQNPTQADRLTKIQRDLDDTKIVMHNAIDAVLERGEKLENLVEKSTDLSMQSKMFYKSSKKANQCCFMS